MSSKEKRLLNSSLYNAHCLSLLKKNSVWLTCMFEIYNNRDNCNYAPSGKETYETIKGTHKTTNLTATETLRISGLDFEIFVGLSPLDGQTIGNGP